jgi:hypothetical protein
MGHMLDIILFCGIVYFYITELWTAVLFYSASECTVRGLKMEARKHQKQSVSAGDL